MAFFPHAFVAHHPAVSFNPLLSLLEDLNTASRGPYHHPRRHFTPRFDVRELEDSYSLVGDFPGLEQKDIEIEFPDDETVTIRRHVERASTPAVETEKPVETVSEKDETNNHHATVEDEDTPSPTPTTETEATAAAAAPEVEKPKAPRVTRWVSERSTGNFERTFRFGERVDVSSATASMKNGSLTLSIPKAKKQESRRIEIN